MSASEEWDRDPTTGDYLMVDGAPVPTQSLRCPAYTRLKADRGKWLYAPDNKWGSDYYLLTKRPADNSTIENLGQKALQPMIDDGRASDIEIATTVSTRYAQGCQVDISPSEGDTETLNLPEIL